MKRHALSVGLIGILMFGWSSIILAADERCYLLPFTGGPLTDKGGQPLNGNVKLEFKMYSDSAGLNKPEWSETQERVPVDEQGKFVVLLGATENNCISNKKLDFTKEKFIKMTVYPDGQDPYDIRPLSRYLPALGAWQAETAKTAEQADNASKLEGNSWSAILGIQEQLNKSSLNLQSQLNAVGTELTATKADLAATKADYLNRLNSLERFVTDEKTAVRVTFIGGHIGGPLGGTCPPGWTNYGTLLVGASKGNDTFTLGAPGAQVAPGWYVTHPEVCIRN